MDVKRRQRGIEDIIRQLSISWHSTMETTREYSRLLPNPADYTGED
jgi:hypothetical protein